MNKNLVHKRVCDLIFKNTSDKSVRQLAEECDVPASTIRKWLYTKGRVPRSSSLKKLSKAFNVSIDYLLGYTDEKKTAENGNSQTV